MQDTVHASACDWTELKTPILAQRASVASVQRGRGGARFHGVSVAPPVFTKVQSGRRPAHWSTNKSTTSCAVDFCRTSNDGQITTPMLRQRLGQYTSQSLWTGLIAFQYLCKDVISLSRQLPPEHKPPVQTSSFLFPSPTSNVDLEHYELSRLPTLWPRLYDST